MEPRARRWPFFLAASMALGGLSMFAPIVLEVVQDDIVTPYFATEAAPEFRGRWKEFVAADALGFEIRYTILERPQNFVEWGLDETWKGILRGFAEIPRAWWLRGATTWYGSSSGSGVACSTGSPCTLTTLLCGGGSCGYARAPGDTLVLKGTRASPQTYTTSNGGVGNGINVAKLWGGGTSGNQITIKAEQWRGVTIDCKAPSAGLDNDARCIETFSNVQFVTLQDLIFDNTSTATRDTTGQVDGQVEPAERGNPFTWIGQGSKVIHCIIKNQNNGLVGTGSAPGGGREMYWNVTYYNGYHYSGPGTSGVRGHGHGIYLQNQATTEADRTTYEANVFFRNGDAGEHVYTEGGFIKKISALNNVDFLEGMGTSGSWLGTVGRGQVFGANGTADCASSKLLSDFIASGNEYWDARSGSEGVKLGYTKGFGNASIHDNFWAFHGNGITIGGPCGTNSITSNTIYGVLNSMTCNQYGTNTCPGTTLPTTGQRPIYQVYKYGAGEGRLILYNWNLASTYAFDPAQAGGYAGEAYEIRTNNNPTSASPQTGTWNGSGTITVNTSGYTPEDPGSDWPIPAESGPAFLVIMFEPAAGAAATPTPTVTSTPSRTPTSTSTATRTPTFTASATSTPTKTPTVTNTPVNTSTPSNTPSNTATPTRTPTRTPTFTPSPTATPATVLEPAFEFEDCQIVSPAAIVSNVDASGGRYVTSSTADSGKVVCPFHVSAAGVYAFWTRVYSEDGTHDALYIDIDGDSLSGCATCMDNGNTSNPHVFDTAESKQPCSGDPDGNNCQVEQRWAGWIWNRVNDETATCGLCSGNATQRLFTLTAGNHILTFRWKDAASSTAGAKLDKAIITPNLDYDPGNIEQAPGTPGITKPRPVRVRPLPTPIH